MSTHPVKEIVVEHITSVEQLEALPGYTKNINPKEVQFEDIVGYYNLAEEIPCQKSNCHTPHHVGYAVKLTDGRVTNVGNVCGKEFGAEIFVARRALADRYIKRKLLIDHLIEERARLPEYQENLVAITKDGKDVQSAQSTLEKVIGTPLFRKLCGLVRHRELDVFRHRVIEEQAKDKAGRVYGEVVKRTIRERAGRLVGAEFLGSDVRSLVFDEIKPTLDLLKSTDFENTPMPKLTKLSNSLGEIPAKINQIIRIKEQQITFFSSKKNFELLMLLALDLPPDEVSSARAMLSNYIARKFLGQADV